MGLRQVPVSFRNSYGKAPVRLLRKSGRGFVLPCWVRCVSMLSDGKVVVLRTVLVA